MKLLPLIFAVMLVVAGVPAPSVADGDGRPLADAGLDQSVTIDNTVYLDGGGSVDPDGEIIEYNWSIKTPSGDTVTPADPDAVTTQFVPEETGRYHVELTVTGDDGQTQSDTLYVDVEASEPAAPTPEPTPTSTPDNEDATATPEPTPTETDSTTPTGGSVDSAANQPPSGTISGPSSVTSGSSATYTIDATDPDGEVSDRWWLPTTLSSDRATRSDFHGSTRTFTVDGAPGTTAEISATVVDDEGATTTLTKAIEVVNTPPVASIEGDSTAVVNTTKEYRVTASDPDSEITSVSLTSGSGAVDATEPMPWDGPTSSGEWARSFRFMEIPNDDGTVTFEATVRDEHGGVATVEKEVTVIEKKPKAGKNPISKSPPEILTINAFPEEGPEGLNEGQIQFTATATDSDSNRLTFEWKIGNIAKLKTTEGGEKAQGNVSYVFNDYDLSKGEIPVSLTVSDQNGNERTASLIANIQQTRTDGGVVGRNRPIQITDIQGRTVFGVYQMKENHAGQELVLNFGDDYTETVTLSDTKEHRFNHQYESAGRYSISINPLWSPDTSTQVVDIDAQMYELWTFERQKTSVLQTTAAESPGENWTQSGIARIAREKVGVETMQTLADGDVAVTSPGQRWERTGTTTEYHTEKRTTESTSKPGEDWALAKRNVDQKQIIKEWQYTQIPKKGLLGGDWEYVETVQESVKKSETKRATTKPDGDGWNRVTAVGQTRDGSKTRTVDSRHHADSSWTYLGAERQISGYEKVNKCTEYSWYTDPPICTETKTEYKWQYDYEYEYRVPQYDTIYKWSRTVEVSETQYRYREPTYTTQPIHEYEKTVRIGMDYAQWEKPVIETTDIYRWTKTEETWEEDSSLVKPVGEVRNLNRTIKECGEERDQNEPEKCSRGKN